MTESLPPVSPYYHGPDRIAEIVMPFAGPQAGRQFIMRWPFNLTADEVQDIEEAFAIVVRGMKRRVAKADNVPVAAELAGGK